MALIAQVLGALIKIKKITRPSMQLSCNLQLVAKDNKTTLMAEK